MNAQPDKKDAPGEDAARQGERRADRFVGGLDLTNWRTSSGRRLARATRWVSSRLGPRAALIMTLVIGALIAIALTAVSTEVYEAVTEGDGVAALDHPLLNAVMTRWP